MVPFWECNATVPAVVNTPVPLIFPVCDVVRVMVPLPVCVIPPAPIVSPLPAPVTLISMLPVVPEIVPDPVSTVEPALITRFCPLTFRAYPFPE